MKTIYNIYVESTPNPEVMKFVSNQLLIDTDLEINSKEEAQNISIANALFDFPFVKKIFINSNFISITKNKNSEWDDIAMPLRVFISDLLNEEGIQFSNLNHSKQQKEKTIIKNKASKFTSLEKEIDKILTEYIKPAVESDGGSIILDSCKDGIVYLILKGSCDGCPSATITLKQGIERLLKEKLGNQIKEVCAS